jgi:hypothetical protein
MASNRVLRRKIFLKDEENQIDNLNHILFSLKKIEAYVNG